MLILSADDVRAALPMSTAIEAMRHAFAALHRGEVIMPSRTHLDVATHSGVTLVMPGLIQGDHESLAVKVVSVFPKNADRDLARIQAAVMAFDPQTGRPLALLEGSALTAIRTAAVSGLATDCLARRDSRAVAVIGTGVQARTHIEAICCVRQVESVKVFGRTPAKAEMLAAEIRALEWAPQQVEVASTSNAAISDADIICTVSTSATPVFEDSTIRPGAHINAVGSYQAHVAEIPSQTVLRSRVVVDQREAAWEEAGDLIQPLRAGVIGKDHIYAELGDLVTDSLPGRVDDQQITLFKSVGLAMQDVMAARVCVAQAQAIGLGQNVDW